MVEPVLYAALGVLIATLLWLMFLPAFWGRAVRLTKKQLLDRLPVSASEIVAGQDRLRAEHAISMRAVERRAENVVAQATAERFAAATAHAADLGRLADLTELRAQLMRIEADGGRLRVELERTRAGAASTSDALAAAQASSAAGAVEIATVRKAAAEELEASRRDADAARHAADQARIEAATREVEIATLKGEIALARAGIDRERALKEAGVPIGEDARPSNAELLRALRERLDEVADAIASAAGQPEQTRPRGGPDHVRLVSPRPERAGA